MSVSWSYAVDVDPTSGALERVAILRDSRPYSVFRARSEGGDSVKSAAAFAFDLARGILDDSDFGAEETASLLRAVRGITDELARIASPPSEKPTEYDSWVNELAELAYSAITLSRGKLKEVKQSAICSAIREKLRKRSGERVVRVLYNACYGGYGYSPEFQEFRGIPRDPELRGDDTDDERVKLVPVVKAFGRKVAKDRPFLLTVVLNLLHYEREIKDLDAVAAWKTYLVEDQMPMRNAHTCSSCSSPATAVQFLEGKGKEAERRLAAAVEFLEGKGKKAERRLLDESGFAQRCIDSYVADYGYLFPEEEAEKKKPWYDSKAAYGMDERTFLELFDDEKEPRYAPWSLSCAARFSIKAVRRILLGALRFGEGGDLDADGSLKEVPDLVRQLPSKKGGSPSPPVIRPSDEVMERAIETLGLIAASGRYSQLRIAEVPELLQWRVGNYDGMESISYV